MNRLQRSSLNMVSSASGCLAAMAVNFVATPFLLRDLGEAGYGIQNLVGVVIGYLTIMDMNLDMPITKFVAENQARQDYRRINQLLSTTLQLYLLLGVFGMVAIGLAAEPLARQVFEVPPELVSATEIVFMLTAVGFLASTFTSWGRAVAQGVQRYDLSNAVSFAANSLSTGVGLVAVYAGFGVIGYVSVRVLGYFLSGVAYFLLIRRLLPSFQLKWGLDRAELERIKAYVGSGILLRLSGLLTVGLGRTLLGSWIGVAAVGVYAVPAMIVSSVGYLISAMLHFIFPMASELQGSNRIEELRAIYVRATRFIAALASVVFPLLLVFGDAFLALWVGAGIAMQAAGVFRLLLFAGYIEILTAILANAVMVGTGHIRATTIYVLLRAGLISVGYILLIRPFSLEGAGLALLLGSIVDLTWLLVVATRFLDIGVSSLFVQAYARPVILGGCLAALGLSARLWVTSWLSLVCAVGVLSTFYVVAAFWAKVLGETERRALMGLWRMFPLRMKPAGGKA